MSRTADQIGEPTNNQMPPAGWHNCECIGASRWKSPKKGTAAVMLKWRTCEEGLEFEDPAFVTAKAVRRLNLIAQRVAGMPKTFGLPDDDGEAAIELAKYILRNAPGRSARVLIEENVETFIYENGPNIGRTGERKRAKVAFVGYEAFAAVESADYGDQQPPPPDADEPPPTDPAPADPSVGDEYPF
jgi:hypothetical protein